MLSRLERLLAELKRRHVLRMAGFYAVAAWVIVQVAATTFPFLGLPSWAVTVVIVLALVGLPVAIVLAWVFELTDHGVQREDSVTNTPRAGASRVRSRLITGTVLIGLIAVIGFAAAKRLSRGESPMLDSNLAAVMPFRVSGGDASTAGLSEGMVDLLAMRLAGARGVRAVDARSAISAWNRTSGPEIDAISAATSAARSLGAGRVITGTIVVTGKNVTIGATLLRTDERSPRPEIESVTGPLDSLLYLVDGLTLALLARDAGLEQQRIGGLTSLPALQAYLAGKSAHRRGHYAEAIAQYQKSLEADSTFALAAMALHISSRRTFEQFALGQPSLAQAFRHRERLSERDRAFLRALGPRYPEVSTIFESVAAFDAMLEKWPDDADAWFEMGDQLLHYGQASSIDDALAKSIRAFERALALDASFYLPLEHLLMALLEQGDLKRIRELAPRLHEIGTTAVRYDYMRWHIALALGDTSTARTMAARLDSMHPVSRHAVLGAAQWYGYRIEDAERVVSIMRAGAATTSRMSGALNAEHRLAMNRGMLRRAQAALEILPGPAIDRDLLRVRDALHWDGDTAIAEQAAKRLRRMASLPASDTTIAAWQRAEIECELSLWNLARERIDSAATALQRMKAARTNLEMLFTSDDVAYCGSLVDAWTVLLRSGDLKPLMQRADSIYLNSTTSYFVIGNLIQARLRERMGDPAGALATIRRVLLGAPDLTQDYISTYLRETARLAALNGNHELAREYYRRYVALRSAADSVLQSDVARAKAELERLNAEPRR
jgi:tetratricopeptide (TPR) repeat protein/TolB-like protein